MQSWIKFMLRCLSPFWDLLSIKAPLYLRLSLLQAQPSENFYRLTFGYVSTIKHMAAALPQLFDEEKFLQALQGFAVPDGEDKGTKWKTYATWQVNINQNVNKKSQLYWDEAVTSQISNKALKVSCMWCICQAVRWMPELIPGAGHHTSPWFFRC